MDHDGIPDLISGSWPGQLYFFKGQANGTFAEPTILKDRDGEPIKVGNASTVFACNFRGTGRLDLLCGNIDGEVLLVPNEGSPTEPAYGLPEKIKADDKVIKVPHGDSHPIWVDWDQTGQPGLMAAAGDGSVLWYRNRGTPESPAFGPGEPLVPAGSYGEQDEKGDKSSPRHGYRAKICVADVNGDGKLDLLLGDFGMEFGPTLNLSAEDQKAQAEAREKMAEFDKKFRKLYEELGNPQEEPPNETAEQRADRLKRLERLKEGAMKLSMEMQPIYQTMSKFERPSKPRGNVWYFERLEVRKSAAK
ncbi:MAG TPA: VCBS repeat-containing protein [Gemmatales bacterium]|nr:VCBS repeat-containing protein [Gemmatales bacterium]HMP58809.1 VCBS repeat-containing protein [Gemmatales bacterium]